MGSSFKYLIKEGFRNMWANRLMSFASIGVLICCLVLMGSAAIISVNVSSMMEWLEDKNVVKVFLSDSFNGTDEEKALMEAKILGVGNIEEEMIFTPGEEAFASMLERLGNDSELVNSLSDTADILPDAYTVTIRDITRLNDTVALLSAIEGVYTVRSEQNLAETLTNINRFVSIVGALIVGLLFLVSMFIITNTIKLTMYVRRLEISIMKSVGATDWFIRMPFLVEGVFIGLISGTVAFGGISYVYLTVLNSVPEIAEYGVIPYSKIWLFCLIGFLGAGILTGVIGSMISIRKYLHNDGGLNNV